MGKLLSLLARDDSNCCTPKNYDVFLDFENAAPTEIEREIYDEVERVLRESESVLDEIQCYKVRLNSHYIFELLGFFSHARLEGELEFEEPISCHRIGVEP